MIIKRLKCDQCGKEENCEVVYTSDDHTPGYQKPPGWTSFDATPPKAYCDKCHQEIRIQRVSPNIGHPWLMTTWKYFCCEECKVNYLKMHPEQEKWKNKPRITGLTEIRFMGWSDEA